MNAGNLAMCHIYSDIGCRTKIDTQKLSSFFYYDYIFIYSSSDIYRKEIVANIIVSVCVYVSKKSMKDK